jgi:putative transcriptional regulator
MNDEDFTGIMAGLQDALAFAKGDVSRATAHLAAQIREARQRTGMKQVEFAEEYRIPLGTLRDWEQGRRNPDAPARTLLAMIAADPEGVQRIIGKIAP